MSDTDIKTLGRYKIQGVLGKGAMGLVYDGLDPKLKRRVAIKTILTNSLSAEAAPREHAAQHDARRQQDEHRPAREP